MKQTAVEWLVEELSDVLGPMDTNSIRDLLLMDAINRAKEMEKEQMIDWYATGQADTVNMYEQHLNKTSNTNEK
jgi:hypothetical protein